MINVKYGTREMLLIECQCGTDIIELDPHTIITPRYSLPGAVDSYSAGVEISYCVHKSVPLHPILILFYLHTQFLF
jgi:hypothetical protein